ncbi:MAG: DUF4012 domain-containing protein [Candidatus Magasanikbacteria bacterium]|nr:DUF4012 domain-containing protein [Candidatus Magasanikbacteria bacterium]
MTFKRFVKISFLTILALLVAGGTFIFFWYRSGGLQQTVIQKIGKQFLSIDENTPPENGQTSIDGAAATNFVQEFFGLREPQTYLIMFLNNTELRPGGGFIGTYAVVTMDKANPNIAKVEGTEVLDNLAPKNFPSEPPAPIREYLGLDRWYFRDSNWSPDFKISAAKSLDLYRKENGVLADDIDAVIGFTPTLVEDLLRISGPVTVNEVEFTADNFTEKLEYEVEYGFAKKNVPFEQRKKMLADLAKTVIISTAKNAFLHWGEYKDLVEKMLAEKQMMVYSPNQDFQKIFESKNWAGEMSGVSYDYLMWVDANLGALKTDWAIERELTYGLNQISDGRYVAKAKMTFNHRGKFDWRTTRYRDYARVYVPVGSKLIRVNGSMKSDKSSDPGVVDQGIENGRQWFGAFISIEPGRTGELSFEYFVSPEVVQRLKANDYRLFVQKQLGTNNVKLSFQLNLSNILAFASPGEPSGRHGDNKYENSMILKKDIELEVRTK